MSCNSCKKPKGFSSFFFCLLSTTSPLCFFLLSVAFVGFGFGLGLDFAFPLPLPPLPLPVLGISVGIVRLGQQHTNCNRGNNHGFLWTETATINRDVSRWKKNRKKSGPRLWKVAHASSMNTNGYSAAFRRNSDVQTCCRPAIVSLPQTQKPMLSNEYSCYVSVQTTVPTCWDIHKIARTPWSQPLDSHWCQYIDIFGGPRLLEVDNHGTPQCYHWDNLWTPFAQPCNNPATSRHNKTNVDETTAQLPYVQQPKHPKRGLMKCTKPHKGAPTPP